MPREVDVNQFRRGDLTTDELKSFVEQTESLRAELLAIIEAMKKRRLKTIHVDGIKKIPLAIGTFQHGLTNIKKGLVDAGWTP